MAAFVLAASFAALASAKSFLQVEVGAKSVESALLSELAGMTDPRGLRSIEDSFASMYYSLPKNSHNRLEPATVRYALHRYFMHKHGWFVNGLGPVNDTTESTSSTILKSRAPAFILDVFEQRLHHEGLGHHDLAVFAATLTDLIHREVSGSLTGIYNDLDLPTREHLTEQEYHMASKAYLISYLSGGEVEIADRQALPEAEIEWADRYPAWEDTLMWSEDLMLTHDFAHQCRVNPFVEHSRSFEQQVDFLQEMGHTLGTFQNLECHRLKDKLVDLEDMGTGRVPLSRFYRNGLLGKWEFTESTEYLRHVGALDENDPSRLSVVIPNYIQSQSNCLAGSSFYSVCCLDECESLFGHLESRVKDSSATPATIAELVSNLPSDTVHAPRNLSMALHARLKDIAHIHGGSVPLHGRLFAQWMHHAYPRECRYPHAIGVVNRISPNDWMDLMDVDTAEASEGDMEAHVSYDEQIILTGALKAEALPWSMAEELIAGHAGNKAADGSSLLPRLRTVIAVAILVSLAVPLRQRAPKLVGMEKQHAQHWV